MATRSPHNHVAFSMWTSVWLRSFLHQKPSLSNEYPGSDYGFISEEERREALQELYGEDDEIEETPRFLRDKLELLEEELDQIHEKKSYELAVFANPNYVESDKFRLMFLRADRFDVRRAAKRIVAYWDRKLELFGPEKAFRPHRFDLDFECNDSFAVSRGGIRLLPHCDDAGRAIIFNCQLHDDNMNNCIDNMVRKFPVGNVLFVLSFSNTICRMPLFSHQPITKYASAASSSLDDHSCRNRRLGLRRDCAEKRNHLLIRFWNTRQRCSCGVCTQAPYEN